MADSLLISPILTKSPGRGPRRHSSGNAGNNHRRKAGQVSLGSLDLQNGGHFATLRLFPGKQFRHFYARVL